MAVGGVRREKGEGQRRRWRAESALWVAWMNGTTDTADGEKVTVRGAIERREIAEGLYVKSRWLSFELRQSALSLLRSSRCSADMTARPRQKAYAKKWVRWAKGVGMVRGHCGCACATVGKTFRVAAMELGLSWERRLYVPPRPLADMGHLAAGGGCGAIRGVGLQPGKRAAGSW